MKGDRGKKKTDKKNEQQQHNEKKKTRDREEAGSYGLYPALPSVKAAGVFSSLVYIALSL